MEMHTGPTDNEIIGLVLQGNEQAFALLVERYKNFVFTIVLRYLKSREDAEEVAQDVFIKAFRSLADYKGASKFSTWLYTICTTTSITYLRKKKQEVVSLDNEKVLAAADRTDGLHTGQVLETKSRAVLVNEAIKLLGPEDAAVLTLFYKGEQTLEEMGRVLGKETNAVKVQLHRARARLKEKMLKYYSEEVKNLY